MLARTLSCLARARFSYLKLNGLTLLLDAGAGVYADAGVTLAVDGGTVQQWNDQSGNGRNAAQATPSLQPIYRAAGINGLPAVEFDVTDDYLSPPGTLATYVTASAKTALAVIKPGATVIDRYVFKDANGYFWVGTGTGPVAKVNNYDGTADIATVGIVADTVYLLEAWHVGGNVNILVNGGSTGSVASGDTTVLTNVIRLGERLNGRVAELATFNVYVDGDVRAAWRRYAAAKYGVAL